MHKCGGVRAAAGSQASHCGRGPAAREFFFELQLYVPYYSSSTLPGLGLAGGKTLFPKTHSTQIGCLKVHVISSNQAPG